MNYRQWVWACGCLGWAMACEAAEVKLPVTRDTWVSAVGQEQQGNNGGSARLKLKGTQEFSIIDVDTAALVGKSITGAKLHLKSASADRLGRVSVSSLASEWGEGSGNGYARVPGAASFRWAKTDQQPWAWAGSDVLAACLSNGGTLWGSAAASAPDGEGWQVIDVQPEVVGARVAGVSHGFVVMDDVGSEYDRDGEAFKYRLFPNRYAFSREQSNGKPYLVVQTGADDREGPAAVAGLAQHEEALPAGEAIVRWATPADRGSAGVVGFIGRYAEGDRFDWADARAIPQYLMPAPGRGVELHLRDLSIGAGAKLTVGIRAVDGAGNLGDLATTRVEVAPLPPKLNLPAAPVIATADGALPEVGGIAVAVVDALDKVHPVTGAIIPEHAGSYLRANHLWSAGDRTVRLAAGRNEFVDFQVVLSGAAKAVGATLTFDDGAARAEVLRFRHVRTGAGPLPDPLVPVTGPFALPAADERVEGQRYAGLVADVYVPHEAAAGEHRGTLTITADGQTLTLKVALRVWDFTLPDVLSFVPEMNCYGLPDGQERAFYRLAHAHRTNLNRLAYNWRGVPADGCAPRWDGTAFAWGAWDDRFGPLLDGSAFGDLPRRGVPVDFFYLPLNENWPVPIEPHFRGGYWAEEAFDAEYGPALGRACAEVGRHVAERGWSQPVFEFFLNNKVYFKKDAWSKSSAPWVFDEPVNAQDFNALRWYGTVFHRAVAPFAASAKLGFRCDVSYPERQRDFLDGVMDVNVCGGAFRPYHRVVMDRKRRTGEVTFNYGSSNAIEQANVQPAAWCVDTWCLGGDGVVPWQTVGKAASWETGDALSLLYPALPGTREPAASVRLKAYRRGQQDVEYLTLLERVSGVPRFAIAAEARDALRLAASVKKVSEEDAGLATYAGLDPAALWSLRQRVGQALDAGHPKAERALVRRGLAVRE